jgi:purine-binding chemotaxis protein CheW
VSSEREELQRRLDALLRPQAEAAPGVEPARFVGIGTSLGEWVLPLSEVVEIAELLPVTAAPNAPRFVLGLTQVRGEVLAVVDLALLLGAAVGAAPRQARSILVRAGGLDACLVVERVLGMRSADPRALETDRPAPAALAGLSSQFLPAAAGGLAVLPPSRLLPEIQRRCRAAGPDSR